MFLLLQNANHHLTVQGYRSLSVCKKMQFLPRAIQESALKRGLPALNFQPVRDILKSRIKRIFSHWL